MCFPSGSTRYAEEVAKQIAHMNLSTSSSQVLIVMESFPQIVDTPLPGFGSSVKETHDIGLKVLSDGIEKPTMWIDLLRVLLLETAVESLNQRLAVVAGVVKERTRRSFVRGLNCWGCKSNHDQLNDRDTEFCINTHSLGCGSTKAGFGDMESWVVYSNIWAARIIVSLVINQARTIYEYIRTNCLLPIDILLHDTVLIKSDRGEDTRKFQLGK